MTTIDPRARHDIDQGASTRAGTRRRRWAVLGELWALTVGYLVLFETLIGPMRRVELDSLAWLFRLFGARGVTLAVGDNLLIASPGHRPILAFISPSCSSLMGILALGTLAIAVLRGRRSHTVVAYIVSASMLFVLNLGRMAASSVAGLWFGRGALLLFHDWVGTVWNFVATLLGFLLLLYLTLPTAERAEQDRYGRHTARRPESWSHAGLGYRIPAVQRVRSNRRSLTGWLIRYFVPAKTRRWLARRRESNRIDFRIGFLNVEQRCAAIATLSANGLETQGASLMALAVFEEDFTVLDALARAVFIHAHDPVTTDRTASLLLWCRAWSSRRVIEGVGPLPPFDVLALKRFATGPFAQRRERKCQRLLQSTTDRSSVKIRLVTQLGDQGLAYHAYSLLSVAAEEEDDYVIQALVEAIAKRQWEPVSNSGVAALRLWARAWLLSHRLEVLSVPELNVSAPIVPERSDSNGKRRHGKRLAIEKLSEPQFVGGVGRGGPFRVAVSGAGGPAGLAVIRALLFAGHSVVALDADPFAAGFQLPGVQTGVVPRFDDESFADGLTSIVEATKVQALICTVAEEYAPLAAIALDLSDLGCKTWIPDLEAVARCLDKAAFAFAMEEYGIAHPPTATTSRGSRRLPGPWIVKPRRGRGSRGFALVDDRRVLRRIMRHDKELIAQSRLMGEEFTADVLVDRNGQVVTCVPRWRLETRGGISVKGLTFDSIEVTRVCAEVVAATGITGPINIQGMVDPSGAVSIIELNPRFSGGLPLTLAAGADVVGAYLQAILEPERRIAPLYFDVGVRMTRYFEDIFETSGV